MTTLAVADTLRFATWHVDLSRRGPGILLRDILKGDDPAIGAVIGTVAEIRPDVLLLTGIDWDYGLAAVTALASEFERAGTRFPHLFAAQPNSGLMTTLDLDGDGRKGRPGDAQGYGKFTGAGGMALLSRLPLDRDTIRDFSQMLWVDVPDATLPQVEGKPFPSAEALKIQRLSSAAHWDIPVILPNGRLHILAFAAGPPVFDGPEDRNGMRNHDEVALWTRYLDGKLAGPPENPVIVMGNGNLDPMDGEGLHQAMINLLAHPRLQDPEPRSQGGRIAAKQGGANERHKGDPSLDTVDWRDDPGPGNLRVSYVLPDRTLNVRDAGVFWPEPDTPYAKLITAKDAPRHRLVWVDLELPP